MSRPVSVWTSEREDQLRELWAKGWSCSMIAQKMGGLTHNAVIGKSQRLHLPTRKTINRKVRVDRPPFSGQRPRPDNHLRVLKPRPKSKFKPTLLTNAAPEPSLNIAFDDLKPNHCRWPTSDLKPFTYCGHPHAPGESYCAAHCREAWAGSPLRVIREPWEHNVVSTPHQQAA